VGGQPETEVQAPGESLRGEARTRERAEVARLVRRQETPGEQAYLLGETLLSTYLEALKVRTSGLPGNQGQERRVAAERRCGPVHNGLESVDEIFLGTRA
jgi:hypothetical protein